MSKTKKVFCMGLLCKKVYRKNKCVDCGIYVCNNICSAGIGKNIRCIDCYVEYTLTRYNKQIKKVVEG